MKAYVNGETVVNIRISSIGTANALPITGYLNGRFEW
jgi:hypothetical protein